MPHNHIESYAKTQFDWLDLSSMRIKNLGYDHIQEVNNISMESLERDYGRKNKKS